MTALVLLVACLTTALVARYWLTFERGRSEGWAERERAERWEKRRDREVS